MVLLSLITLLNGVFYTANNIAMILSWQYYVTDYKRTEKRVHYRLDGILPFYFCVFMISLGFRRLACWIYRVDKAFKFCGGDAAAWRTAIIYAIIGLSINTISALSVKELPEEELNMGSKG